MNLSFDNHCVSNSPSKLEGVGGEYVTSFDSYHTPQSLRDSSSILEEQPDIQPFTMCPTKVPLRGTSISRCLPPSCEPRWGSCMVLLMIRLFEPFDLFEVMTWSFATPSQLISR